MSFILIFVIVFDNSDLDIGPLEGATRLAIGFGLLTVHKGRTFGVPKNLRVCGDCYTTIKYVSKVTSRVVISRDHNRVHRFETRFAPVGITGHFGVNLW